MNTLMKEIKKLYKSPPEGITVQINEDNMSEILATIEGPQETPFEGGQFKLKLALGDDFPNSPPKGWFLTKIFHPNVSGSGEICVNTLKKDWKPTHGIEHVLTVIRCLLIYPNPESALNEDAGKLLLEAYDDYAKRAKLMTKIHAKPRRAGGAAADAKENEGVCAQAGNVAGGKKGKGAKGKGVEGKAKKRGKNPAAAKKKKKALKRL